MNTAKRWVYDLTEKQFQKIIVVVEIPIFILVTYFIACIWPILGQIVLNVATIFIGCIIMVFIGLMLWMILWDNPYKQIYLLHKKQDEVTLPNIREKFGLSSEFKEVIFNPKDVDAKFKEVLDLIRIQGVRDFAKEVEDGILVSIRNQEGKEISSKKITDYNYFDLNYEPKI